MISAFFSAPFARSLPAAREPVPPLPLTGQQNGYPPPVPQGLPPLARSSPTGSIWSSSASMSGSEWSSFGRPQQLPYWNAAQAALLQTSYMGGPGHMLPQQGAGSAHAYVTHSCDGPALTLT